MNNETNKNTNIIKVDSKKFQKMIFIMNALDKGWKVKKVLDQEDKYIFIKKHYEDKEIFLDTYLERFTEENLDLDSILL
jgi:hypothetical protein